MRKSETKLRCSRMQNKNVNNEMLSELKKSTVGSICLIEQAAEKWQGLKTRWQLLHSDIIKDKTV